MSPSAAPLRSTARTRVLTQLDGYVRVSRVGGRSGESFISTDVQRQQIEAWAERNGVLIGKWHEELDKSGGTLKRPKFQHALARVEAGETGGLIVAKLDRFARSIYHARQAIERMDAVGGRFVSVADDFDMGTSSGRLMFNVMGSVAEFERDRIIESWDTSNASAIARGIHFTRVVPFGYVRGDDRRLAPDLATAPFVVELFRRRARRDSWRKLSDYLNNVAPRENGKRWGPRNAATIVKNRAYLGEAFHGEHRNADAHPAIVTMAEYEAAEAVTGGPGAISRETSSLLGGLIRCAGCRYAMKRTFTRYADGRRVDTYVCAKRHTGGRCAEAASVVAHKIEPLVVGEVLAWLGNPDMRPAPHVGDDVENARRLVEDAEARLADFLADDELRSTLHRSPDGRRRYLDAVEARQATVDEVTAALDAVKRAQHADERRSAPLWEEWGKWSTAERGDALRQALDAVYVRKGSALPIEERVMILWTGQDDHERPQRGTSTYVVTPIPWPSVLADPHADRVPGFVAGLVGVKVTTPHLGRAMLDLPPVPVDPEVLRELRELRERPGSVVIGEADGWQHVSHPPREGA